MKSDNGIFYFHSTSITILYSLFSIPSIYSILYVQEPLAQKRSSVYKALRGLGQYLHPARELCKKVLSTRTQGKTVGN